MEPFLTHLTPFKVNKANFKDLFNHHAYLVNCSDFLEKMQSFSDVDGNNINLNDNHGVINSYFRPDVEDFNIIGVIASGVETFFKNSLLVFKKNYTIILAITVSFMVLIFLFMIFKYVKVFLNLCRKKPIHVDQEMESFNLDA